MVQIPTLSRIESLILDLLIKREDGMYGLEMVKASPELKRGTIYVTLQRMADKGYVTSEQVKKPGDPGLPKRLFRATAHGRQVFAALAMAMNAMTPRMQGPWPADGPRVDRAMSHQEAATQNQGAPGGLTTTGRRREMRDVGEEVNELVDKLERGEVNRRQFIRAAAALGVLSTGLGSFVKASAAEGGKPMGDPGDLKHTGFVVRVAQVDTKGGNSIEGLVHPGVVEFWQRTTAGDYVHTTVAGTAVLDVNGEMHKVPAGDSLVVKAGQRFTYKNSGRQPYRFKASHPFWTTGDFTYGYGKQELTGDEVWFEIKQTPTEQKKGPVYRLIAANENMTYAVVSVPPGSQTLAVANPVGRNIVTSITGSVDVAAPGADKAATRSLKRGEKSVVARDEAFRISNRSGEAALVEMRPDPLTIWEPETQLWENAKGQLATGDQIWFEIVIPS